MGSPTTPTHGKLGALYVLRPNGFSGTGVNDVTWGAGSTAADLTVYEVVIDGVGTGTAGVDTFKWRVNGGAWTETVDMTGAAQTLADGQQITFADDGTGTPHTAGDQWVIGNLKDEAATESTTTAQITDATARILNPNAPPTFTDSGGETVLTVNYTNGTATFTGNVTAVTVTGNNGFIPRSALRKVGYLVGWNFSASVDMADSTAMGDAWKTALPGQAGGSGSANAYFIAAESMWLNLKAAIDGGDKYFLLELFNYDPDQDQTGDHFTMWVSFTGFSLSADIGSVVKDTVNFQIQGAISFTANA